MALVHCSTCGVKPPGHSGYKRVYIRSVPPLGHPKSALVCGSPSCSKPGLIWLEQTESDAYDKGERIFGLQTNTTKLRAE